MQCCCTGQNNDMNRGHQIMVRLVKVHDNVNVTILLTY